MLHNLRLLHVNKISKIGQYRNEMKCWKWHCSHCSGNINLSAVQRTWWSRGAFAEASSALTWQHNELIVISQLFVLFFFSYGVLRRRVKNGLFTTYLRGILKPFDSTMLTRHGICWTTQKWPSWPTGKFLNGCACAKVTEMKLWHWWRKGDRVNKKLHKPTRLKWATVKVWHLIHPTVGIEPADITISLTYKAALR